MTKPEAILLVHFLEDLSDKQGNACCNDFNVPNTDEYWGIVRKADEDEDEDDEDIVRPTHPTICTYDWGLVNYLKRLVMEEHGLLRADIQPVSRLN